MKSVERLFMPVKSFIYSNVLKKFTNATPLEI